MERIFYISINIFVVVLATSCGGVKKFQYLQGSLDTVKLRTVQLPEPLIQKGDLLGILVYSDNAPATAAVVGQPSGQATNNTPPGFLVDQRGNIQLFKLGVIPVEGMTRRTLADTLALLYVRDSLLSNPYIEVRFLNYKVTLVGEVNSPGSYTLPTDKINAFEAIGLAGDITPYGRRDNLLVVREVNGVRQFGNLNLQDPEVFLSPFYYLKQNDLIVVDVAKGKIAATDQTTIRVLSISTTILSTVVLIYSVFFQ